MGGHPLYGTNDATFVAAGGADGIRKLVDAFYDIMGADPSYETILKWHPSDLELSRDKLARFLCGWMGGPNRYEEKYGAISIPGAHSHLSITARERDMWLECMSQAMDAQGYPADFKAYLLKQLSLPAERVRQVCEINISSGC